MIYRRLKISHDPNNVNWTRATSGFGHRILSSQGWTPGSFLGARNAAHADMFTAASASHIRVSVKDDTLGLGARPRRDALDEPTGLDAFKGLLGRLNGKSDVQLEEDQRKRDDVKLARYAATKYQMVRFISGGLLTQEKLDPLPPKAPNNENQEGNTLNESVDERNHETSVHRTAIDNSNPSDSEVVSSKKSKKKSAHSKRTDEDSKSQRKREKKAKKRKHSEQRDGSDSQSQPQSIDEPETNTTAVSSTAMAVSKERRPMGRNAIRGRHIAQKKKALLDDKSLNEVRKSCIHICNYVWLIVN